MKRTPAVGVGLLLASAVLPAPGQEPGPAPIDPAIPEYRPVEGVSGNLKSIGSDTMNNEMTLWAEKFKSFHPGVRIEIEGKGSGTAPPALVAGTAHFGPMSRPMKEKEIDEFEGRYGYPPTAIRTSLDVLAVYVHRDNPVETLTLPEIDAIFSKTRRGGFPRELRTWGDLGLSGRWTRLPISLYGRNSASGTYGFFKEHALFKGDFKDEVKEQPGSSSVVQGVGSDPAGIGYSGIGYRTADVRAVPLSEGRSGPALEPTVENAYSGDYPLGRFLYLYVNRRPGEPLDPLRREFLLLVLSREGQEVVVKTGCLPLPAAIVEEERRKLGGGAR